MVPVSSGAPHGFRAGRPLNLLQALVLVIALYLLVALATSAGASAPTPKSSTPAAQTNPAAKISNALRDEFVADADGRVRYLVVLSEQADVTNNIRDWKAKGRYVLDKLMQTASATQPKVRAALEAQRSALNVERFKSYYIINAFQVVGNLTSAETLAALNEVAHVTTFPVVTLDEPLARVDAPLAPDANTVEWNVDMVDAPEAWAMGYDGTGVVVGSLDTGTRWTHEALKSRYRGWNGAEADHNHNWWDPVGGQPEPYDTDGHGTHTMGTIVGVELSDPNNHIGVAPGAKWISSNGIAEGASDGDIIEAGEFMLAPWDLNKQNPNPDLRPVVVSNSWGHGPSIPACPGGEPLVGEFFRQVVGAWIAAGIFPSFSAGNAFPQGNRVPAAYPETFETGALSPYNYKASYSSIGPSCFDLGQHPQIMAGGGDEGPGLSEDYVHSSYNGGDDDYEQLIGTSMAQPATAGAVAILKQANPDLTIPETWHILTSTAYFDPSWGVRPNPAYGWGRLQIDAAVEAALELVEPTVTGTPPTATSTRTPTITRTPTNTVQPTATPACAVSYMSSDVPKTIVGVVPVPIPVTSTLQIQDGPTIAAVDVISLTMSHTYPDDLEVYLISPSGTRVRLFAGGCGSADWNQQNTGFTLTDRSNLTMCEVLPPNKGNYEPQSPLSVLSGQSSSGTWTLEIIDETPPDGGTLHAWGLRIYSNAPCGSPGQTSTVTVTGTPPTATITRTSTRTATSVAATSTLTTTGVPSTATRTSTSVAATATRTSTPAVTGTSAATSTGTRTPTRTATVAGTSVATTATATACPIEFQDVPPSSGEESFYPFVQCLACRGIIGGYPCGGTNPETRQDEPCGDTRNPYYRPSNQITRGQISKVVAGASGSGGDPGPQMYQDVAPNSPFYQWINRLSREGVMGGYPCGGPGEPCREGNRPYFRPGANATRGQMTKIVSNAAGFEDPASGQSFEDVPPSESPSSYYQYVERLFIRGIAGGYPCGGTGEKCGDEGRPYFRPNNPVTRGQAAKIAANTFFPNCQTSTRR